MFFRLIHNLHVTPFVFWRFQSFRYFRQKIKEVDINDFNQHNNPINIINTAKNALKMKNSDTFYRIRIVLLTWVESTILIQSENTFAQLRTLISTLF